MSTPHTWCYFFTTDFIHKDAEYVYVIDLYLLNIIFMLLYLEKYVYLDSFKNTHNYCQIGQGVLNRRLFFTVLICVKNISKFYMTILRNV
jgi:hypothetical protein